MNFQSKINFSNSKNLNRKSMLNPILIVLALFSIQACRAQETLLNSTDPALCRLGCTGLDRRCASSKADCKYTKSSQYKCGRTKDWVNLYVCPKGWICSSKTNTCGKPNNGTSIVRAKDPKNCNTKCTNMYRQCAATKS